jgi:predicted nucleotidyltransferase
MSKESLTPYSELDATLKGHAEALKEVLGENFTGFYLIGSLAIGDFDLTSDIDFIVVTNWQLSDTEVKEVQEAHTRTCDQDTRWVQHLEYSFFPVPMLLRNSSRYTEKGPNTAEDRDLWYFNNGSKIIEKSGHDNTLVTRWTLREKGVTVLGPEPATFVQRIEPNELRREIRDDLINWGKETAQFSSTHFNRFHQAFFVLNSCRVLQGLNEGRVTSKLAGVKWAKCYLDPKWTPLIDFCWQERQDTSISIHQPADPEVFSQAMEFVGYAASLGREYQLPS